MVMSNLLISTTDKEVLIRRKTKGQLEKLQRILTEQLGTRMTKTEAVEIAINGLLDKFSNNPDKAA